MGGQRCADVPDVHQFIVGNECNQPLFLNPQWNTAGQNQSAAICGRALAATYDALKSVSPSNFVWGVGLSPRGNDSPNAASNSSTSPVKFLGYLGAWFKSFAAETHRTAPLMDGLDFHPYPVPQSLPFARGYPDPRDASINLPRIYQAFYDGFNGTPQKTIGQQPGGGLPVSLNEMGIQTDATRQARVHRHRGERERGRRHGRCRRDAGLPGDVVHEDARLALLRPERAGDQHLPPRGRAEPRGLAERPVLVGRPAPVPKQSAGVSRAGSRRRVATARGSSFPGTRRRHSSRRSRKHHARRASRRNRSKAEAHTLDTRTCVRYGAEHMFAKPLVRAVALAGRRAPDLERRGPPSGAHGPKVVYRVKAYDTLWTIAQSHYGGDVRDGVWQIQQANHLAGDEIAPGERLVLP